MLQKCNKTFCASAASWSWSVCNASQHFKADSAGKKIQYDDIKNSSEHEKPYPTDTANRCLGMASLKTCRLCQSSVDHESMELCVGCREDKGIKSFMHSATSIQYKECCSCTTLCDAIDHYCPICGHGQFQMVSSSSFRKKDHICWESSARLKIRTLNGKYFVT